MMKNLISILLVSAFALPSFSQNEEDALRYSQTHFGGTARYNGMGGAFGALGGDVSSASQNPAGVGVFRSSEFTFTPSLESNYSESSYLGTSTDAVRLNANFNNLGYVYSIEGKQPETGWLHFNFAFGYNQTANFSKKTNIEGVNNNNSLVDTWVNKMNANGGVNPENINENPEFFQGPNMAWQTYLIDYDTSATTSPYYSALQEYGQTQNYTSINRGRIGESYFAFGSNYKNKLYLGASLASSKVKFSKNAKFTETRSETDTTSALSTYSLNDRLNTEGRGVTARVGFIYRIADYIRLGAAVQSPTYYNLSDAWSSDIEANFDGGVTLTYEDPSGSYDYYVLTPMKTNVSGALQVKKAGIISAEYEYIDYRTARLSSQNNDYSFTTENDAIKSNFVATGNLKLGTEWRYQQFKFRGGYSYFGNPLSSSTGIDKSVTTYSLGAGYKNEGFFLDLAYNLSFRNESLQLYSLESSAAETLSKTHRVTATCGFRF